MNMHTDLSPEARQKSFERKALAAIRAAKGDLLLQLAQHVAGSNPAPNKFLLVEGRYYGEFLDSHGVEDYLLETVLMCKIQCESVAELALVLGTMTDEFSSEEELHSFYVTADGRIMMLLS